MTGIRFAFPFYGDRLCGSHVSGILLAESPMRLGVDVRFALHVERDGLEDGSVDAFLRGRGHDFACLNLPEVVDKTWAPASEVRRRIAGLEAPVAAFL